MFLRILRCDDTGAEFSYEEITVFEQELPTTVNQLWKAIQDIHIILMQGKSSMCRFIVHLKCWHEMCFEQGIHIVKCLLTTNNN